MRRHLIHLASLGFVLVITTFAAADLRSEAQEAMRKAIRFYHDEVSTEGGYLYRYSADLKLKEGEGVVTDNTVWVQPPGTPAVGMALVEAYERTGDETALKAARDAGEALIRGQLHSGGWTGWIHFDPEQRKKFAYRVDGKPSKKARNVSTLDDDKTQAALRMLMRLDKVLEFKNAKVHEAVRFALDEMLKAQYANGAWAQGWDHSIDPASYPPAKAKYPSQWPREYPGHQNYWWRPTFNDGAMADAIEVMFEAAQTYDEPRYREAALRAGEFILMAQMPEPQPAWAQQYNEKIEPVWARKFEPPAITASESQGVIATLMLLYEETGEKKWLEPIPAALAWLKRSELPDGQLARFYELKTNKPLYFTKDDYQLTYDDGDLPTHYGFKVENRAGELERRYQKLLRSGPPNAAEPRKPSVDRAMEQQVRKVIAAMDERGAWVEEGELRDHKRRGSIIESRTFIRNLDILGEYIEATNR